jgi:hypothetical protein
MLPASRAAPHLLQKRDLSVVFITFLQFTTYFKFAPQLLQNFAVDNTAFPHLGQVDAAAAGAGRAGGAGDAGDAGAAFVKDSPQEGQNFELGESRVPHCVQAPVAGKGGG